MKRVPRDVLVEILSEAIEKRHRPDLYQGGGRSRDLGGTRQAAWEIASLNGLVQDSVERQLREVMNSPTKQFIHFKTADQWLTGLDLQHLWYSDPRLMEYID